MDKIEIEDVRRLDVQPGDVLLVTVPPHTTQEQADRIKNRFETMLPVRAVLVTSGIEVEVAREGARLETQASALTLERRDDGVYLVGDAPTEIDIAHEMLGNYDPTWMKISGDAVTFTLANGTWRYLITERHEHTVRAVRVVTR